MALECESLWPTLKKASSHYPTQPNSHSVSVYWAPTVYQASCYIWEIQNEIGLGPCPSRPWHWNPFLPGQDPMGLQGSLSWDRWTLSLRATSPHCFSENWPAAAYQDTTLPPFHQPHCQRTRNGARSCPSGVLLMPWFPPSLPDLDFC
jgi:hypothetical protein